MITKTCILIAGANCSGKTSVARGLIDHFGGIGNVTPDSTFSADGRAVFAGRYANVKHGGVDYLNSTKPLQGIVRNGLLTADFAVCEGSYLDTFGMNLLNAIFEAKRQAYVALWCSRAKLYERNRARLNVDSLAKRTSAEEAAIMQGIYRRQDRVFKAAKKYASIGVPVLAFDTGASSVEEITEQILKWLGE